MSRALGFWLAILLVFAGVTTVWISLRPGNARSLSGTVTVPEQSPPNVGKDALSEFEFVDQQGQPFGSDDLEGQVWIGSFFFADCPSLCVSQNNEIAKLQRRFADQGLKVVSITVAPSKDPPHKLRQYAQRFTTDQEQWKFLTGRDMDYVRRVGVDIFALAAADETHTAHVAVFDRTGQRRGAHKVTSPEEYVKLVKLIEELLDEPHTNDDHSDTQAAGNEASHRRLPATARQTKGDA